MSDMSVTLVSQIIVQLGIKVQVGKISKINKSAGWNKAVQVGIFGIHYNDLWFFPKNLKILIKVQVGIRACRLENFEKLIRFAALLFGRLKYLSRAAVNGAVTVT